MRLSVGSDMDMHVAKIVFDKLRERGHEVAVCGPVVDQEILWPEVARRVAEDVAAGRADEIVFDNKAENSDETTEVAGGEELSDEEIQALWLRRVQTKPADFLRSKFAFQQAAEEGGGE